MTAPITLEDYDPRWPHQFEALRSRIAPALGPLAAAIEHIGSTSVPGLAAKPIIDLDILLRSHAGLADVIKTLASLGYQYLGDQGVRGREAFRSPASDFPHHLYVCLPDSEEYRRHLAFRNHLRTHPQEASAYANLKRTLAQLHAADRESYTLAKTEFIEEILNRDRPAAAEHFPPAQRTLT